MTTFLVLPVKVRVLSYLSLGECDCKGLANLMCINEHNLRVYLRSWEKDDLIQRVNLGSRPVKYKLIEKGRQELVLAGRRR